jgi:hypothetical protein
MAQAEALVNRIQIWSPENADVVADCAVLPKLQARLCYGRARAEFFPAAAKPRWMSSGFERILRVLKE